MPREHQAVRHLLPKMLLYRRLGWCVRCKHEVLEATLRERRWILLGRVVHSSILVTATIACVFPEIELRPKGNEGTAGTTGSSNAAMAASGGNAGTTSKAGSGSAANTSSHADTTSGGVDAATAAGGAPNADTSEVSNTDGVDSSSGGAPTSTNTVAEQSPSALSCGAPRTWPSTKSWVYLWAITPGYSGPRETCGRVGDSDMTGSSYVSCRAWGDEIRSPARQEEYNHYWLWTDLPDGKGSRGWISALYITGGNDEANDTLNNPIPDC